MQHIIQIAFDFDDAKVTSHLEDSVEKYVKDKIVHDIESKIFQSNQWSGKIDPERDDLKAWVKEVIKKELLTYKDEMISRAVKDIVDSTKRSKAFKEKLNESLN